VKESDWKVLRDLKGVLLERYCQRALAAAEQIIQGRKQTNHERYLALFSLIEKQDKALGLAFDDVRRSNALSRITFMRSGGLFTEEEFARFSPETQEQINRMVQEFERV